MGDHFHAGLLQYFDEYTAYGYLTGLKQGGHHNLAAGLGTYGFEPSVSNVFGIPTRIYGGGAVMNIPIVNVVGYDGPSVVNKRAYTLNLGIASSDLEHAIPERMFSAMTGTQGISAIKALQIAQQAGQRLYLLTPK